MAYGRDASDYAHLDEVGEDADRKAMRFERIALYCTHCGGILDHVSDLHMMEFCPLCATKAGEIVLQEKSPRIEACPKCRRIIKEGYKFCPGCSKAIVQPVDLVDPSYCACGAIPDKEHAFCPKCGVERALKSASSHS